MEEETPTKIEWAKEKYQCPYCELKFRNKAAYLCHVKVHKFDRVER